MPTTHTPGPWFAEWHLSDGTPCGNFIPGATAIVRAGYVNARERVVAQYITDPANAALIAAAPAMLAALQDARRMVWHMTGDDAASAPWNVLLPRIDSAIAKATGSAA